MYEIPKTLEDCLQEDQNAIRIKRWGNFLNIIGYVLSFAILGGGIHISLSIARTHKLSSFSKMPIFDESFFWIGIALSLILAIIVFVFFRLRANAFRGFAGVIQNTRVSSNVSLYQAYKNDLRMEELKKHTKEKAEAERVSNEHKTEEKQPPFPHKAEIYEEIVTDPQREQNFINILSDNGQFGKSEE